MSDFQENRRNFHADPSRNPETNRRIKIGGRTYQMLVQKYGAPGEEAPRPEISRGGRDGEGPRAPKSTIGKVPGPVLIYDILRYILTPFPFKDYSLIRAFVNISPTHKRVAYSCVTVIVGVGDVIPAKFAMAFPRIRRIEGILGVESKEEASHTVRWLVERSLPRLQIIYRSGAEVFPPGHLESQDWGLSRALALALESLPHQENPQTIPDYVVIAKHAAYNISRIMKPAAMSLDIDAIEFFIERGAKDQNVWNLGLKGAAQGGHRKLAEFFISRGAGDWNSGLAAAARGGHQELVDFFIEKGASDFESALLGAAKGGHANLFRFFRERITTTDIDYWHRLLTWAVRKGHREIVDLIETESFLGDKPESVTGSLLNAAIASNDLALVERYIADGMDVDGLPQKIMGMRGNMNIIRLIVEKTRPRFLDKTAMEAAKLGRLNVIAFLNEAGRISPQVLTLVAGAFGALAMRATQEEDFGALSMRAAQEEYTSIAETLTINPCEVFMGAVWGGRLDPAREYMPAAMEEINQMAEFPRTININKLYVLFDTMIARGDREMIDLLASEFYYDERNLGTAVAAGDRYLIFHILSQGVQGDRWIKYAWGWADQDIYRFIVGAAEDIRSLVISAIDSMWAEDLIVDMVKRAGWDPEFKQRARSAGRLHLADKIALLEHFV